jgi:hypothetical protein
LPFPAVTRSVTSNVPPADIGTASGAFTTMRQLGGAFGVAVLGAAFAATGSYASPSTFSSGFVTAAAVGAAMALVGAALGMILPRRGNRPAPAVAGAPERGRPVRAAGVPGDLAPGELALDDQAAGDLAPGDAAGTAGHARGATR